MLLLKVTFTIIYINKVFKIWVCALSRFPSPFSGADAVEQ